MHPDQASIQQEWAALVVEELVRHGVTAFYASPGSRSTPLVLAAGRNPRADIHMHVDERGSAFMALGHARMSQIAAAWITTSGTAVANGHPAVVEARLEGIPMLLLTADRPPELRDTYANQTIRQPGLFGADVVWSFDMPVPSTLLPPSFVFTTVAEAVRRSRSGPVHLNCMFREPLHDRALSEGESGWTGAWAADVARWKNASTPWTSIPGGPGDSFTTAQQRAAAAQALQELDRLLAESQRPLLMLGRMPIPGRVEFRAHPGANSSSWPVLADISSQYRSLDAAALGTFVFHYDAILHDRRRWAALSPDLVLQLGRPPVSKRWQQFLEAVRPDRVIVADLAEGRIDPGHLVTARWDVSPHAMVAAVAQREYCPRDVAWAAHWKSLSRAASERIPSLMDATTAARAATGVLVEQACVREVTAALDGMQTGPVPLVLGNSLTVRHADTFSHPARGPLPVVVNRGASGIDGQVSTAIGAARAAGRRAVLILGDLTLLHDINALAAARDVTIVVLNNDGGGIFSWLPVASEEDLFTPLFSTPHGLSFKAAADLFGLIHEAPGSARDVGLAVERSMSARGGVLIELRTDRDQTLAYQREMLQELDRVLEEAVSLS
ncbi:MAG: 2-succinyl-5-enolpyruvyl-6-hydroxy-3-cyclohexene-1-carboxylic-acid synthase [Bacteroidetes bacterium CG12_big_fil_rev_8_21_14_0_65_60_17]|nr:MAG: 2-succinyl-5-enolpyruvyl-6-hydroxy-3-cyclohexene-1-carboxylic-acid synthase [Bacteroidetes bacterium CG12_big_fil_rev_8_21_14_0_65_60_17]